MDSVLPDGEREGSADGVAGDDAENVPESAKSRESVTDAVESAESGPPASLENGPVHGSDDLAPGGIFAGEASATSEREFPFQDLIESWSHPAVFSEDDRKLLHQLYCAVIDEFRPSGIVERSLYLSIAVLLWRKHRANVFTSNEDLARTFYEDPLDGPVARLTTYLAQSVPERSGVEQTLEPNSAAFSKDGQASAKARADTSKPPSNADKTVPKLERLLTPEEFLKALEFNERLDASIEIAIQHLCTLQAAKTARGMSSERKSRLGPRLASRRGRPRLVK